MNPDFTEDILAAMRQKEIESLIHYKAAILIDELWALREKGKMVKFQDTQSQNIILRMAAIPSFPLLEKGCQTLKNKLASIQMSLEPQGPEEFNKEELPPLMITLKPAVHN